MGCVNSQPDRGGEQYKAATDPEGVTLEPANASTQDKEKAEADGFQKWSEMENAEEMTFINDEQGDASLEQLLDSEFPMKPERQQSDFSSIQFWQRKLSSLPDEPLEGGFKLGPPWTMEQAKNFYRHLSKPREDGMGTLDPCVSRKDVYAVMVDAFAMLEKEADDNGALQNVPPPTTAAEKLFVCGDTHGQLQDVLWIFELHGLPSATNRFLFNGDIADRGNMALEIFMLLFAFKLAEPTCLYVNRGNHEQRDLNERPFANGGGFAWELREKYPHDEHLIEFFQRAFVLFPIAALVGQWAFVIHGGLFRQTGVTIDDIKNTNHRRQPPLKLDTRDDEILFDALWADPHEGDGVVQGSTRGGFSIQFGADVTKDFCRRTGVKSVIRSHQLPKKMRGFEILHDSMLLTIFSASNYGGVCRNRGGVLVFDEKGPAEVKEFYAPTLEQIRDMYDTRMVQKVMPRIDKWRGISMLGNNNRQTRQKRREDEDKAQTGWIYMLEEINEHGVQKLKDGKPSRRASRYYVQGEGGVGAPGANGNKSRRASRRMSSKPSPSEQPSEELTEGDRSSLKRHSLIAAPLRGDAGGSSGSARVHQIVFTDENDGSGRKDGDILRSMLTELCRHKAKVMTAFSAAELESLPAGARHKSTKNELPYEKWCEVLCQTFPVFSSLWREYGPKLAKSGEGSIVYYRRWLDRFQVRLEYDHYAEFEISILKSIGERLSSKTREMSLNQLLNYFDPDRNGSVDSVELYSILEGLDLGLSKVQLNQLIFELGFRQANTEENAVEVMVMLLQRLPIATKKEQKEAQGSHKFEKQLSAMRSSIRKNIGGAKEAFNLKLLELFQSADADKNGLLSHDETKGIIKKLLDGVSASDATGLIDYIDFDRSGEITFLEFVAALGTSPEELEERSSSSDVDDQTSLSVLIIQQICAALYQIDHAMQKAFTRIDSSGSGWLTTQNFAKALSLVASSQGAEQRSIDDWQINAFVESLKGSNLCDAESRVDYARFLKSFYIVDVDAPVGATSDA